MLVGASNLLLFTQNVERVKLYHLQADETDPSNATLVFDVHKQLIQTIHGQPGAFNVTPTEEGGISHENFSTLPKAAAGIETVLKQRKLSAIQDLAKSLVLSLRVEMGPASESLFRKNVKLSDAHWLVSYAIGKGRALKMSLTYQDDGFIPVGSVAVSLEKKNDSFVPQTLSDIGSKGSVFCYLPLPIQTGLPVHINGSFALQPNRRYLCERTEDDKHSRKADWNEALLEDAVCNAYLQLLQHCSLLDTKTEMIEYFLLWPALSDITPNLMCLLQKFYFELLKIKALPLLKGENAVIHLDQAVFLDPFLAEYTGIGKIAMKIFRQHHGDDKVVEVPQFVLESFTGTGHADFIIDRTYLHDQFFAEIFFPNIEKYSADLRDPLVLYAIDLSKPTLDQLLFHTPCIPVAEKGERLRKPCDLVHPHLLFAKLFDPADQRFPCGDQYNTKERLVALQKLGMQTTDLTWQDITERAESIQNLRNDNQHVAHLRLQQLCAFLDRKLTQERTVKTSAGFSKEALQAQERIQEMEMLQISNKPQHFPLSWAGEHYKPGTLLSPDESYPKTSFYLLSSAQPLVEDQYMSDQVKYFLGLSTKEIPLEHVLVQLEHALALDPKELALKSEEEYKELFRCCHKIYEYLQKECLRDDETAVGVAAALRERKCLLIGSEFVSPHQVAFINAGDCSPYLYSLPAELNRRFKPFMTMLGVRSRFSTEDYVQAINLLQSEVGSSPLKGQKLDTSIQLVNELDRCMRHENLTTADVQKHGIVYIPNAKSVLQPAEELCYNDCPWLKSTNTMNFTHPSLAYQISTSLGVKTKRQEALSKHSKGIPFGQKERLTNSLRRILNTYPCDHEILKEMIQNADDAQAANIHFVKDTRHHKDTHVFENSWKKLQGPALCVYNNKPFSRADLEGIQNLGEGSKVQDPSKTGQYGIGFNSVYHLTDVPSLLTSSPELGEMLCVFDPHCSYVPGATPSEPGMRFDDLSSLREAFPDVFSCYLEEQFKLSNATLFRLPLRNRAMAERSDISKNTMTVPKLQAMLSQLKNEAFEILLFTNHLKQICVSDIDSNTGQLTNTYSVFANMSKTDVEKRQEFHAIIKKYNEMLKSGEITVNAIPNTTVMYDMLIADSEGRQELWRVTQSLGFNETAEIPSSVIQAFDRGDLALLPRSGAACLLEKRMNGRMEEDNRNRRVYCFLPLPIETDLPVHINGHFALGYENRRHLWTPTGDSGYKFEWNHILCTEVVTASYVNLLESIRMHGLNAQMEHDIARVYCSRQILEGAIHAYQGYFPTFSETKPEWDSLVRSVYRRIAFDELPLLPAIRENPQEVTPQQNVPQSASLWHVSWLPPNGEGNKKAFFSKLENSEAVEEQMSFIGKFRSFFRGSAPTPEKTDAQILKELLLDCGFKLLEATLTVVENFQKAGVDIDFMSPEGVLLFFKSYSSDKCTCELGSLPAKVEDTPFRDVRTVRITLEYCQTNPAFLESLDGLPLLVTKDNTLRIFDKEHLVFVTKHDEIVPQRADLFIHPSLRLSVFKEINLDSTDVFRQFSVEAFAEILHHRFEAEKYKGQEKPVEWSKHFKFFPTESWLREVWSFIWTEVEFIMRRNDRDKDKSEVLLQREVKIKEQLETLNEWALIPAKKQAKNVLVSIKQASDILDLRNLDYNHYGVRDILIKLQIPQLDSRALNSDSTRNADLVRLMTTTMDKPKAVLDLVHKAVVESDGYMNVTKEESVKLLRYFSDNIDRLVGNEEAQQKLKDFPIYNTIHGDLIKVAGCLVYTLPARIPTNDIDVWQSKSGTVFLERNDSLQNLYDYLGCATIGVRDVYCQFILQHFEYLSPEARMVHLQHIYQHYIKQGISGSDFTEEDKQIFMESLKELNFIEDKEGVLHSASDYYDPENVLFRVMLPEEKLPPRSGTLFKESDWLAFLRKLGLKSEVTKEMTLEFAQKVAYEGKDTQSASTLTKSKVLTQHLLTMKTPEKTKILEDVAEIKFIAPEPVSQELTSMYPQYGDIGNGKLAYVSFKDSVSKDHEKLIWTQSSILPTWADPMKQHALPQEEKLELTECLQVRKIPPAELVVLHLKNLIDQFEMETGPLEGYKAKARIEVFKAIYRYLQQHALEDEEPTEKLRDMTCIAVENSKCFVKPRYTVLNLYQTEEIKPFLYKVPLEFGEFEVLFNCLGSTANATFDQYASVLSRIAEITSPERLTPNEMKTSCKAVHGLFLSIEKDPCKADITTTILYLPAESGRLIDSTKLVFNDMPSFYERVKNLGLQFLVDLKECGIKYRNFEDMLNQLPQRLCPGMLSSIIKETLVDKVRKSVTSSEIAAHLSSRLTSEAFLRAVARLVRHECHKSGKKLDEPAMFGVLDRLSTIKVYGVSKVLTHLTCRGRAVAGSEMEKTCFMERIHLAGPDIWNVYIKNDADLSQDLLIPLAEVINSILTGLLRDSVLYLLPLLACSESQMHSKLDALNVRVDHTQLTSRVPTLPPAGQIIPEELLKLLQPVTSSTVPSGDYVAYTPPDNSTETVYAVCQGVVWESAELAYMLEIGEGPEGLIVAPATAIQQFISRH